MILVQNAINLPGSDEGAKNEGTEQGTCTCTVHVHVHILVSGWRPAS